MDIQGDTKLPAVAPLESKPRASYNIQRASRWLGDSSNVRLAEYYDGVLLQNGIFDSGGLETCCAQIAARKSNCPSLTVIFIDWLTNNKILEISARGMQVLCDTFSPLLMFLEGVFNEESMVPLGFGFFQSGDLSLSQDRLEIFYECTSSISSGMTYVLRQYENTTKKLTYICIGAPKDAFSAWIGELTNHMYRPPYEGFALDAIIAEEGIKGYAKDVARLRLRLLSYEHGQHLQSPKETTLDLHNLSQSWHIVLGNLLDSHNRIGFLLKSQDKVIEQAENTHDRMRLECLFTKVDRLRRWVGNYRDRTNIRINLAFHLTSQVDNETNLQISNFTSVIARDAQQDSSSMITIAAVTMFFLPGTFVSAIFSMTFFNVSQDASGNESFWVSKRWWYYIVITVPLTLLVFVVWLLWRRERMRRHEIANAASNHKPLTQYRSTARRGIT